MSALRDRLARLQEARDVSADDLDALWADCTPVRAAAILGA